MRGRALVVATLLVGLAVPVMAQAAPQAQQEPVVERIFGSDRYATAIAVSRARFPGSERSSASVASGADFPDALGATAAGGGSEPLLLTPPDAVAPGLVEELQRLQVGFVTVVGGTAAVSEEVLEALRAQLGDAVSVERVAGAERTATAAALSRLASPDSDTAVITGGGDFADAVSGGPLAAGGTRRAPLLLVGRDHVPAPTAEALLVRSLRRVLVLGGAASVGDGVLDELRALTGAEVTRVAGGDRFATAAAASAEGSPAGAAEVVLATGRAFPDTLAAGAAAAAGDGPLLLTEPDALPHVVAEELRRLRPRRVTVVGGPAAVSDGVVEAVRAVVAQAAAPDSPATPPPPPGSAPGSLELIVARDVERCEPGGRCSTFSELVGTSADGSTQRPLVDPPQRSSHSMATWRPDGGAFAYIQDFGVRVAPVDGDEVGEPVLLRSVPPSPEGAGDQSPCNPWSLEYSHDGSRLLVLCENGSDLLVIDVAADRVVSSAGPFALVAPLADGRVLGLRRELREPEELVVLEPADDGSFEERVVPDVPGPGRTVFSMAVSDPSTVVLKVAQGNMSESVLLVASLDDASVRELVRLPAPSSGLDVSPDGASVAVWLEPGTAAGAVVALDDGSTAFVSATEPAVQGSVAEGFAWRPDGASLALASDGDVVEVTPDARVIRTLVEDVSVGSPIAWRPPR